MQIFKNTTSGNLTVNSKLWTNTEVIAQVNSALELRDFVNSYLQEANMFTRFSRSKKFITKDYSQSNNGVGGLTLKSAEKVFKEFNS